MVAAAKQVLRRRLRGLRSRLPPPERAAETAATIATLAAWLVELGWPPVASYVAAGSELDLDPLHRRIWERGGELLLPRVCGDGALAWHRVDGPQQLVDGYRGIREPDPTLTPEGVLDGAVALLVPGVGFTADGHRLGQGGGFYDRVLARGEHRVSVGIGFGCQGLAELPLEAHDGVLDRVLIAGRWSGTSEAMP